MHSQRVTSLLQGVTDVRNWIVAHIPLTTSMLGYDLFLKIGNDFFADRPLALSAIRQALAYPAAVVDQQVALMEGAGLVYRAQGGTDQDALLLPTQKFVHLLESYSNMFESVFIVRKGLRDQQLLVASDNKRLRHFAESVYDHFYDLGWLYLHNFGGVCFLMAALVARAATDFGYAARVESGYVEIHNGARTFLLGAQGMAAPDQVDGHAFCVVDESLILDFGLGNVRKGYRRDFHWALCCDYRPVDGMLAQLALPGGDVISWKNDWRSPATDVELDKYQPLVERLFAHYDSYFRLPPAAPA